MKKYSFKEKISYYFKNIFPELFKGKMGLVTTVNTISGVVYPLMSVLVLKYILDIIKAGQITARQLVIISGIFTIAYIISRLTNIYLSNSANLNFMKKRLNKTTEVIRKSITMDFHYFEDAEFGLTVQEAFQSVGSDGAGYEGSLNRSFNLFPKFILAGIFIFLLGRVSILVLLVSLASFIINIFLGSKKAKFKNENRPKIINESRKMNKYMSVANDFSYGKDIRIFKLKDRILDNIYRFMSSKVDRKYEEDIYDFKISIFENMTLTISDLIAMGIFSYLAIIGKIQVSDLIMLLSIIAIFSGILTEILTNINWLHENIEYVLKTEDFLESNLNLDEGDLDLEFDGPVSIRFENVSFKYPGSDKMVFENLSFDIEKGKTVAIIGINGAGKTTIVKLLIGLYKPTSGNIYINDIDANSLSKKSRFRLFSAVFQETSPLALTVAENVAGRDDGIDRDRIKTMLEKVGLLDKVESFENGIDQNILKVLYEDGKVLSGGENQKLMIARALYKEGSSVMIMDEPTSALDALAEEKIYQEFDYYMGDKTGIFISHRLASTRFCDDILFLDGGKIAAIGSHQELLEKSPAYKEMYEIQGKYYKEGQNENI